MDCTITPARIDDLERTSNLFQSGFWARFRYRQQYEILPFRFCVDGKAGQGVVVFRPLGSGYTFAYLPWAPNMVIEEERQGQLLESMASALLPYLPVHCLFIRFDLFWESPYDIADEDCGETGGSERPPKRIRELRMNFNTCTWNIVKAPTNGQPVDSIVLDVNKDPDLLLKEMKNKTRYNIRLSERRGVEIEDASVEKLPIWYDLYKETMRRKGIVLSPYSYFNTLFSTEHWYAEQRPAHAPIMKLLMAKKGGEYLGGIVLAVCGNYALYLYGASGGRRRDCMPNYRLQWEAIRLAQAYCCETYDFHGIPVDKSPSNPMYGLYQFKRGFGGKIVHRRGCWDYPIDKQRYHRWAFRATICGGYFER